MDVKFFLPLNGQYLFTNASTSMRKKGYFLGEKNS